MHLIDKPFSHRSLEEKLAIKRLGRPLPDLTIKQNIKSGTRTFCRTFKSDYYSKIDWLCGCDTKNALFCFPCLLFCGEQLWTKSGLTDINHLSERVKKHQASNVHIKNVLQLALVGTVNIAEQFDSQYRRNIALHNEKVRHNRYARVKYYYKLCSFLRIFRVSFKGTRRI